MLPLLIGLIPVFIFLGILVFLDNYKLVPFLTIVKAILYGLGAAVISYFINDIILHYVDMQTLTRYLAPIVEESVKAGWIFYLIKKGKIGFLVDGAILGFAVGSGFALAENIYFFYNLDNMQIAFWILRGFGTAVMHGGNVAILAIVSVYLSGKNNSNRIVNFLPGWIIAIIIHSVFNQFLLPPLFNAIAEVLLLPLILLVVFSYSEKQTQQWLQTGFDTDVKLLEYLKSGKFVQTRQGRYLSGFKTKFKGEIVMDLFCYLRIFMELAIRAKGILMMRESGLSYEVDPAVKDKFDELNYLKKSIGKSGLKVLKPLLHTDSKELWQIYFLEKQK